MLTKVIIDTCTKRPAVQINYSLAQVRYSDSDKPEAAKCILYNKLYNKAAGKILYLISINKVSILSILKDRPTLRALIFHVIDLISVVPINGLILVFFPNMPILGPSSIT